MSIEISQPPLDSSKLAIANNLSEINAAGVTAQHEARTNIALFTFHSTSYASVFLAGCYYNGTDHIATSTEALRGVLSDIDDAFYIIRKTGLTIGDPFSWTGFEVLFSSSTTFFDVSSKPITNVGTGGISFTGTGAKETNTNLKVDKVNFQPTDADFIADYAWKGKIVYLDLSLLTANRTMTFNAASGWVDGDFVNFLVKVPNGSSFGVIYTSGTGITVLNGSEPTKVKQTKGAVTLIIESTTAHITGKLSA